MNDFVVFKSCLVEFSTYNTYSEKILARFSLKFWFYVENKVAL